ncbi:MAG: Transketolase central region [Candidatus Yanofskybacteria bacterium GW2011_GWD2_39_48]|uniref:Transketolase central region n=1 Tax=Candidatus Yanofskybacteria bacterium GW2011_GWD2_39_48 TaxID=1619031 RepID=A0A0G0P707_9BACT|nr:MAG: Transketolase central region [Candidatus Yanofskybacteria bacterium GW2011_GWD2_39_48]
MSAQPCDAEEARKATIASVEIGGPVYIRLSREATPVLTREDDEFKIGKANILRAGKDVTIVGCGWILSEAILASEDLAKEGIECEVINMHTVSPIDTETLVGSVNKTGCIVSAEDHQVEGGLGSAIAQTLAFVRPTPQEFVAVIRQFGQSGTAGELIKRYGLDAESIKDKVRKVITRK